MIKLELPGPKPGVSDRVWIRWRSECETAKIALIRHREHGEGEAVKVDRGLYHRETIVKRYYHGEKDSQPFAPFYRKCVYCETTRNILEIEHFRPRQAVADARMRDLPDATKQRHPGYYWLAYEVNNLLLACDDCNNAYKGCKFPLANERARAWASTDDLSQEAPLLLNPFVDDPSEHLDVEVRTGILTAKTERGERTIQLLRLNLRSLPERRRVTIDNIEKSWSQCLASDSTKAQQKRALDRLKRSKLGRFEFTLTARAKLTQLHARSKVLGTAV
jgi:hypothetical protein